MANPGHDNAISQLNNLIRLDLDAILAYTQALENITLPDVRNHLANFRSDHERHVTDLQSMISSLGGEPVEIKSDSREFYLENFVEIRRFTGNEGALSAMKVNEELTNTAYEAALSSELPAQALDIVTRNYDDEKRHSIYLEQAIDQKAWESKTRKAG